MPRDRWLTEAVKMKQSQSQPSSSSPGSSIVIHRIRADKPAPPLGGSSGSTHCILP